MANLRVLAEGRDCQVRIPGVCNGNKETTALCHFRLISLRFGKGTSKVPDLIGSWACSSCHAVVDSTKDPYIQLAFAHGVFRTQAKLIEEGEVKW